MYRIVLIDGNAILHRAYHALPDTLTLKDGTPTNAVYGFTSMLLKVVQDLKPTHLICAFDLPKPTFRDELYEGYRAQRPETPEKLVSQVEMVKDVVRAFGVPIYEAEGYEADDVIGTLAEQAEAPESSSESFFEDVRQDERASGGENEKASLGENLGEDNLNKISNSAKFSTPLKKTSSELSVVQKSQSDNGAMPALHRNEVTGAGKQWNNACPAPERSDWCGGTVEIIIVTGDRDLLQLVNKHTKLYMPVRGLSEAKLYGEEEVKKKYGIKPEQMVDYKALVGDPSDNYPGVRGVGPKTAQELLEKFGNLETVYKAVEEGEVEATNKAVQALGEYKEDALMAKKLARIVMDAPVKLDIQKAKLGNLANEKVEKLFLKLQFKTLWRRVEKMSHRNTKTLKHKNSTVQENKNIEQLNML